MRIIGIDPGLKATGYGIIDQTSAMQCSLIETGTIEPKPKDHFETRIHTIYRSLKEILEQHEPDVLVLEKLYAHYKHPVTASIMGHARGVVCLLCAEKKIKLIEESVKRIRQALTGNGNASKIQTKRFVAHRLHLDENKLTLDASDALALALGYMQLKSRKV